MLFSFGNSEFERVEIDVLDYEQPESTGDHWDDNWLTVEVRVKVGGFRGEISATIIAKELASFLSELRPLYEKLKGTAEFKTMEKQLNLRLVGDGRGQIELCGHIMDKAGTGNCLSFSLHFDQTQLYQSIHELEKVVARFSVR